MEFFSKVIDLIFWGCAVGGFLYMVIGGMSLAKAIKAKNAADQEDATYGIGAGAIIFAIGTFGVAFFPAMPSF